MYGGVVEKDDVSKNPSLAGSKMAGYMCYYGPKNIFFFKLHSCYCYGNNLLRIKDS